MSVRIRPNDLIAVTAGKDRGRQGRVMRVLPKEEKVIVEGINFVTRHIGHRQNVRQSGRTQQEAPLHISNVKIVCPGCNKPSKLGSRILEDGSKVRVCKACNEVLE